MSSSAKNSLKLTLITSISRVLGLVRDHFLARFFGTGIIATYWEIAYMFPNMLRNLLAEGILSQAFIPLYSDSLKRSHFEAKKNSGKIITFLFFFFLILVGTGILIFPYVLPVYVGKPAKEIELLITLSRILFGFIGLIGLTAIFSGILYTHQIFIIPSLSPILLNLTFLFCFLGIILYKYFFGGDFATSDVAIMLSITVLLGSGLILMLQIFYVYKKGWGPILTFPVQFWKEPVIRKLLLLVAPAILGASIFQLNQLMDIFLASYFVSVQGAIPALRFSHRLIQLPTGMIGVAISTTILPTLTSYLRKEKSKEEAGIELIYALRFSLFLTIPAGIGLFMLGPWIIHFLFSGGVWNYHSTLITYWSLQFYSLGIPFYSMNKILTSTYYAYQDTRTPVKILIFTVLINLSMNIVFIPLLEHGGLALSTSLSAMCNSFFLLYFLKNKNIQIPYQELFIFLKQSFFIYIWIVIFLYALQSVYGDPFNIRNGLINIIREQDFSRPDVSISRMEIIPFLFSAILGTLLIYFLLSSFWLKQEWQIIRSFIKKK